MYISGDDETLVPMKRRTWFIIEIRISTQTETEQTHDQGSIGKRDRKDNKIEQPTATAGRRPRCTVAPNLSIDSPKLNDDRLSPTILHVRSTTKRNETTDRVRGEGKKITDQAYARGAARRRRPRRGARGAAPSSATTPPSAPTASRLLLVLSSPLS
jgi:hypothetical protein